MTLTSLTSCETLGPTSLAPIRITMLFGERTPGLEDALRVPDALEPACVRFLTRRFAILRRTERKENMNRE